MQNNAALDDFRSGVLANLPVALSASAYGAVLGVLAARQGLGWLQLLAMNLTVFAGSAQFVMVDMWLPPLPLAEMTLAVAVINLRYMLVGASLAPLFSGKSLAHKCLFIHLVVDENWAVTMAEVRRGGGSTWFLLGGGVCMVSLWCAGTMAGHRLSAALANPGAWALDFVFTAVFTALCAGMWRGRRDALPWIVAVGLAVPAAHWLPGKWHVVIGGAGGALAAALTPPANCGEEGGEK